MSFNSFFKGVGDLMGVLSKMVEIAQNEGQHSTEVHFKGPSGSEGVYGVSVRTHIGNIPPAGNIPPHTYRGTSGSVPTSVGKEEPQVAEGREPLIDIFDEEQEIVIVAELPGVNEQQISIEVQDDILSLHVAGEYRYTKEILLPSSVDIQTMQQMFRNDILEIRLKKVREP